MKFEEVFKKEDSNLNSNCAAIRILSKLFQKIIRDQISIFSLISSQSTNVALEKTSYLTLPYCNDGKIETLNSLFMDLISKL